ncbi:MAG TPA: hypothetical protein VN656_00575 [Stellaceae bacterium]|jgi:hypothetical protein|nr:hypothetical protein [Stellaceae bacterium]
MNDRKPVIIAVAVGGLALAANGAAALIAISASSSPPEAAAFGIIGLTAAFIGLIFTIIWAFRDDAQPSIRHERVFTPWSERDEEEFAPIAGPIGRSPLALARVAAPAPALTLAPAASEGQVIYIAEWLKARGIQHA